MSTSILCGGAGGRLVADRVVGPRESMTLRFDGIDVLAAVSIAPDAVPLTAHVDLVRGQIDDAYLRAG